MKRIICLLALSLIFFTLPAQVDTTFEIKSNEFGIHAGFLTGAGFSYRHWFDKTGIQLTVLPIKASDLTFLSTGISLLQTFYRRKYIMVYGYLGNHYYFNQHDEEIYNPITGLYEPENVKESGYNIGIGPGLAVGKVVRFNIQIGYGIYDIADEFNMLPSAEMGVYYLF